MTYSQDIVDQYKSFVQRLTTQLGSYKYSDIADILGISPNYARNKIKGYNSFKLSELIKLSKVLADTDYSILLDYQKLLIRINDLIKEDNNYLQKALFYNSLGISPDPEYFNKRADNLDLWSVEDVEKLIRELDLLKKKIGLRPTL